MSVYTVPVDPILISSIQRKPIPATNRHLCGPFVPGMTREEIITTTFVIEPSHLTPSYFFLLCNRYDPYSQVTGRVHQLRAIGHTVDKVEFVSETPYIVTYIHI
jgi:hypothetical protein